MQDEPARMPAPMENLHITFPVRGMTCAACAQRIERVLRRLDGVVSVSVNLASEMASVTYDAETVRLSAVKAAVVKAGFSVPESAETAAGDDQARRVREIHVMRLKLLLAAAFCLPLLYLAMAPMLPFALPIPAALHPGIHPLAYGLAQLFLTLPVLAAGYRFYTNGFKAMLAGSPNMDTLIAIGTAAAMGYSLYSVVQIARGDPMAVHALYFESAGVIITLILLGKRLESASKRRTGEAIRRLMGLTPRMAFVLRDGTETEIPAGMVEAGDIVAVRPGARIPADGTVLEGRTAADESMLTGESMPVDKGPGDFVHAASINTTGHIRFRAEKIGGDTALGQIIRLVEDAQGSKAPIAKLADVTAGVFVPIVCAAALTAGTAWYFGTGGDLSFALRVFISVLVIACPCALGLATPAAIMAGTGRGAERGILIKSGEALETAHKIQVVVLDKTGTVTEGKPSVTDILPAAGWTADSLLQLAASAEHGSEHPLGQAIVKGARDRGLNITTAERFEALAGRGAKADMAGQTVLAGNRRLMEERGISADDWADTAERLAEDGKTPVFIAADGMLSGVIAVADTIKPTARAAVARLREMGAEVIMVTGDNPKTAAAVARQVGIDRVLAEVLPRGKAEEIKKLQSEGKTVAMVGDGINDAPALTQADAGIAVGSGTDVAIESADIVLTRADLLDVPEAVELSRRTMRAIKQNLCWAFGYNVVGIPIAAGVLYLFGGPLLNPMIAAGAMSLSSVSVVLNALRAARSGKGCSFS